MDINPTKKGPHGITRKDLIVGHVYEAKRPRAVGIFDPVYDDRQVLFIGVKEVQYDSPTVKDNRHYPKISIDRFIKWAARDITESMPKGKWRRYKE